MNYTDRVFYVISIVIVTGFLALCILQNTSLFSLSGLSFPCGFRAVTGFFCPGCGGTHAVIALCKGQILKSFIIHPFVLYLLICALTDVITNTIAIIRKKAYLHFHMVYVYIGVTMIFVQWIAKNIWLVISLQK